MASIDDTIATLEAKLKQAKARKQQLEARKRALEQKRKRTEDTRRKILVGAVVLAKMERGEWPESDLLEWLDEALTRPDDRALFGLGNAPSSAERRADMEDYDLAANVLERVRNEQEPLHSSSDVRTDLGLDD